MTDEKQQDKTIINPIDPDKVADNPGLLPYAHHAGSALIKPEDRGKITARGLSAMEDQTEMQLDQIREQIEVLAKQARRIQERKEISEFIYQAAMGFEPLINKVYYLYRRKDETHVLSLVAPDEWGRKGIPYSAHIATALLLADHTWQVMEGKTDAPNNAD
ncbi:MAG: DUF2452 domain-containing protein [Bacteroidia bacterium]